MDLIDRAVEKGTDKTGIREIDHQTWDEFNSVRAGKKLVLFGAGACAEFFFFRYGMGEPIEAVIDNNKAGRTLEDLFWYSHGFANGHLVIQEEKALKEYDPEEIVVLVCSTNHCTEILSRLSLYGIKYIFILHIMELNWRAKNGRDEDKARKIENQTWDELDSVRKGKKLVFCGIEASADFFFFRYGMREPIEAVIDFKKEGRTLEDLFWYTYGTANSHLVIIKEVTALKEYVPEEIVILIGNSDYYTKEFINRCNVYGIKHVFVLSNMESNRRAEGSNDVQPATSEQRNEFFIEQAKNSPIDRKKIIFYAFGSYSDHGKYISEMLWKLRKDLDIVWCLNHNYIHEEVPNYVRVLADSPSRYLYEMSTAHIWVFNREIPEHIEKREGQIYFQVKHWSSVTLKKCYLDSRTLVKSPHYENWVRNSSMIDYIFTGSPFDSDFCRRAFGFKGEMLEVGSPRSDVLFAPEEAAAKVREFYQIPQDGKILLYAPTFRFKDGDCSKGCEYDLEADFPLIKNALEERFGGEWYIFLRLHPNVLSQMGEIHLESWMRNVTAYQDSQELVAACDVLISDFSSIMFEPAFVHKPVFLFAEDFDNYVDKEYELAIEYESLPFSRAETNEQLAENIRGYAEQEYVSRVDAFMAQYGVKEDGHAAERAAKYILDFI